jgi:hypothetical protein
MECTHQPPPLKKSLLNKVTRLGEFSPTVRLFS